MERRKELKLMYKETPRPTGVYQIKNNANGKTFIGVSRDLPGIFNRNRFQLSIKAHPIKTLQKDWESYGADAFSFDTLELLDTSKLPTDAIPDKLTELEEKWLNKLQPYDDNGYNKQKDGKVN